MAYQDFLADWLEFDPLSRYTVAENSITITGLERDDKNSRIQRSFGAGYWSGDWDLRFKITTPDGGDSDSSAWIYPIFLTNEIDDPADLESGGWDFQGIIFLNSGGVARLPVFKVENGARTTAYPTDLDWNTTYYITFQRDDDGGANGTGQLILYVATGGYYGAPGSSLHGSATVDCGVGEQNDFQIIMLGAPRGDLGATQATDFYLENLDLAPASASKAINPTPSDGDPAADFSDYTLSWEDGGDAETYSVYIGDAPGSLTLISEGQSGTSLVVPEEDRLPESVDTWYWRIDSCNVYSCTTGDVWSFTKAETPTIDSQSGNQEIDSGDTPTPLSVTASGNPAPTYQWYADGSPISGATSSVYAPAAQESPITISYVCRVTNFVGYVDSDPMVVVWNGPSGGPARYNILNLQLDLDRS